MRKYLLTLLYHFSIINDKSSLLPPAASLEEDEELLADEPFIDGPVKMDYGYNVK